MQDLLETIHGHFSRSFVAGLSSPMLLTGGKGSGKTTLAHLVGEAVANDRDILAGTIVVALPRDKLTRLETVYIDVARLDGEARLKDTKEKMDAWITDATQRRPCLLILDGLDTLLSAENEVSCDRIRPRCADRLSSTVDTFAKSIDLGRPLRPSVLSSFPSSWYLGLGYCE